MNSGFQTQGPEFFPLLLPKLQLHIQNCSTHSRMSICSSSRASSREAWREVKRTGQGSQHPLATSSPSSLILLSQLLVLLLQQPQLLLQGFQLWAVVQWLCLPQKHPRADSMGGRVQGGGCSAPSPPRLSMAVSMSPSNLTGRYTVHQCPCLQTRVLRITEGAAHVQSPDTHSSGAA